MKQTKNLLSLILCFAIFVSMVLCMTGCEQEPANTTGAEIHFTFVVVGPDAKESTFQITTDKTTVGEALLEQGLIEGEQGDYGLYVKTVNGITLDYEKDGKYWAFYVDGEYGMSGVDTTEIVAGSTYTFKAE